MDMKPISSGKLRAIGYDAASRKLRVRFDDGSTIEYSSVGQEIWRRFSTAASAWSVFRDNIDEEFTGQLVSSTSEAEPKKNPLDDLFGKT